MKSAIRITVSGTVQGVLYRANAVEVADSFKLTGYVRNLENGSVELFAEGEKTNLEKFRDWCAKGPKGASVDDMSFEWLEFGGAFKNFIIRH